MSKNLSPLQQRLSEPSREISLDELAQTWFMQQVEISIVGYGVLAKNSQLLPFIRRAWGSELMKGASKEALDEKPCLWTPPCALDVFFNEQLRQGKHGLAKPYVLEADNKGQDLTIKLCVFGFACDWLSVATDNLVRALRERVSWKKLAGKSFLPKFEIAFVRTGTIEGLASENVPNAIEMGFITPVDGTGQHDIIDEPHSIIGRLARRVDGLAKWQDAQIIADWEELSTQWKELDYWVDELEVSSTSRWSARQKSNLVNRAVIGSLSISGNLAPIWPLLLIGQNCHVGRGAVIGLGRYDVKWVE